MILYIRKKWIIITGFFLIALGIAFISATNPENTAVSAQNSNWGLSFQSPGKPPIGNASADELSVHDAYFIGNTEDNKIYLTFDAGFENGYTPKILDVLRDHNVHATFFLVGNYLDTSPELVRRMVNEGHTVANHTATHPDMSKIADIDAFAAELHSLEAKYKTITGEDMPRIYRPPQGKFSLQNLSHAHELGYKTLFWSLAYVDWYTDDQPTHDEAFAKLLPRIHPGAIVLLHSTSKTNAEILDELLTRWENAGYIIAPINDLFTN